MTYHFQVKTKKPYVPVDLKYLLYGDTENDSAEGFLNYRAKSLSDKIIGLYQELYMRRDISTKLIKEVEEELLEASSELYQHKYTSFLDSRQKGSLEKRIDLLEKTRWSETVDYWRDAFKIKQYLFQAVEEYRELKAKRDLSR